MSSPVGDGNGTRDGCRDALRYAVLGIVVLLTIGAVVAVGVCGAIR